MAFDIDAYYGRLQRKAGEWKICESGRKNEERGVWLWRRERRKGSPRFYLSAGVHGDEPAGPEAVVRLLERPGVFDGVEVFLFPALNPAGLRAGTRGNADGVDLNRDYLHRQTWEVTEHVKILKTLGPVDMAVCLHEDWEAKGAYVYYLRSSKGRGCAYGLLAAMEKHVGIDKSEEIDGHKAELGVIERSPGSFRRKDWPEAIYLCRHHTNLCYTLETPSGLALSKRVEAHAAAVEEAVRQVKGLCVEKGGKGKV